MKKPILVQKFGGTSVMTTGRIRDMARLVVRSMERYRVVVVVSAMGKTTDSLVSMGSEVAHCPDHRELDVLLSTGEQITISLMALAIKGLGAKAVSLTGYQADILTDSTFGKARILNIDPNRICSHLDSGSAVVVAGFQGRDMHGNVTTLGRGGSDTTAVALAAVLGAEMCEVYTDVDGVHTADPRIVPEAMRITRIGYEEMIEMAGLGGSVMYHRAVDWAHRHGVLINVRSSFIDGGGTIIGEVDEVERPMVTAVTHTFDEARVSMISIPRGGSPAAQVFGALRNMAVSVDMITMNSRADGTIDLSFTLPKGDLATIIQSIQETGKVIGAREVKFETDLGKVSIVGRGIMTSPEVPAAMFDALRELGIAVEMVSTSELRVTCVIGQKHVEEAVRALHRRFFVTG
ncbi:MAG: aspartate kinase [Candidatus Wallbacteria bacterium HGW-Wallbacteria-1]|jgi:aspartate kinase|uniref:Aspartokinase n=1 Tax=Candidatus Wallbacteria bacterium HGW-Wallbacteria-1 TaxID=2013854 RepID=A0A2N1PSM9_9BACT|nr:MAG: aspartate kinase [Candidatus Wallbacteria bacterium HGW-Wallbacteria-1]